MSRRAAIWRAQTCLMLAFFGFSPMDAAIMDPQHRVFLECAWEALEDAGYDPETYSGAVGVFAGSGMNAYMMYNLISNPDLIDPWADSRSGLPGTTRTF